MTNPILGEIAGLSPGAKSALMQAHQNVTQAQQPPPLLAGQQPQKLPSAVATPPTPSGPPPTPTSLLKPPPDHAIPQLGPAPAAPEVQAPRGTLAFDQAEHNRLEDTGSGISQIHNPFLRGLAMTGNVIGHLAAPGLMRAIPGTVEHHQGLLQENAQDTARDQGLLNNQIANEGKQAQIAETNARTDALVNPQQKFQPLNTDHGEVNYDPRTGETTPIMGADGQQVQSPDKQFNKTPEEEAFEGAVKGGMAPLDAFRAIKDAGNVKDASLQQQYLDAVRTGDTQKAKMILDTIRATSTQPKIDIHTAETAGSGNKQRDAMTEKEYTAASKDLNTQFSTAQTQMDSIGEAQNLINSGAVGQALGVVKTIVGLAGGKGTGVRITQAELNSLAQARGIQGNFEGWLNKLSGKGNLSGEQIRQINAVLSDASQRLQQKRQGLSGTLDKLGQASSPQEIRQITSEYRHQQLAGDGGASSGSAKTFSLKQAMGLPFNKGKSEAAVRADLTQHGYQVTQ